MSEEVTFYACDCGSEAVAISKLDEFVTLATWRNHGALRWRYRLRYIWHILTVGQLPYFDDVLLNHATARELAAKLIELAEEEAIR